MHGKRVAVPSRVRRVAAPADAEFPGGSTRDVFYLRAKFNHAQAAGVVFFVMEGMSPAAIRAAFKTLPNKIQP